MGTFKHNKKRNNALIYEFLIRNLSESMVDKRDDIYSKTLGILRKYYSDGTPLAAERELFSVIKNTRGVAESAARRILAQVQVYAKKMDGKLIDIKKSNIIKEINYSFGKDFFSKYRIPEYKLLASTQMLIDAARTQTRLTESVQKIQLEEGLVKYMMTRGSFDSPQIKQTEVDGVVMAMVAKKFSEKYNNSLLSTQKKLLEKYVRAQVVGDERQLVDYVNTETNRVLTVLDKAKKMDEVKNDQAMLGKIDEACNKLKSYSPASDKSIEELMLFQKLAEEVESDG